MNLLELHNIPIFEQLQIEEALLRADQENWCILNHGSPPAIVFGISGKPHLHIDKERYSQNPVPLIRRFSGGGTVLTDPNTLFITFICNVKDTQVPCSPREILFWTEELYRPLFNHPTFHVRENDYAFGEKKFGGNAHYLTRDRWLHHTCFLWSYDPQAMKMLALPSKQPTYRQNRSHDDFLTILSHHLPHKLTLFDALKAHLPHIPKSLREVEPILNRPHRKATHYIKDF